MKKLLYLLLPLLPCFQALAQNKANPVVTISYGGVSYSVTTNVPKNYYALTSTGKALMEDAVKRGVWNLVTEDGCVIPAGTKPPKVKPTCSNPGSGTSVVAYNQTFAAKDGAGTGQTFQKPGSTYGFIKEGQITYTLPNVPGSGTANLVIEYQSPATGTHKAGVIVNGGATTVVDLAATDGSLQTVQTSVTLNKGDNTIKIGPSQGYLAQYKITVTGNLVTTTTATTGTCDLALSVNSPSVDCNTNATLTAIASGTAATGLSYSWTGPNGYTASGASIVVNLAQNGSFPYTVTASKTGCSKSATGTVTVTGCTSNTAGSAGTVAYRADTFDYPSWPVASTSNKYPVFENSNLKITLALDNQKSNSTTPGGGGAIWKLVNKNAPLINGKEHTLIYNANRYTGDDNSSVDRSGFPNRIFWGQGLSDCLYKLPRPLYMDVSNGAAGSAHDPFLGLNPNECGDDALNSGELQEYNVRSDGQAFHNKTRPPIYGQTGFYMPLSAIQFEKWVQLAGRALKINYQANFNQVGSAQFANERVISKQQEAPCLWVNGLRHFRWYDGDSPFTNGSVTSISAPNSGGGNAKGGTNNLRPGGQFMSENWIAAVGDNGYGIGLVLKHNYQATYGYFGDGGFIPDNPHMGGSYGYIAQTPIEILDHVMSWRHEVEVVVGTVDEIRAYAYSLAFRPDFTPKFKWSRAGREGWYLNSGDGSDKHTWDDGWYSGGVAKNGWQVQLGASANAVIASPAVIWKASDTQNIYLKYKYSGNQTTWSMSFQRNAQKPNGAPDLTGSNIFAAEDAVRYRNGEGNGANQTLTFTVIPDGQEHVATIPVSSLGTWQGVINRVSIRPHAFNDGRTYNSGETVTLYWMNNTNSDPFPNN